MLTGSDWLNIALFCFDDPWGMYIRVTLVCRDFRHHRLPKHPQNPYSIERA
jgi:hypothetical protein